MRNAGGHLKQQISDIVEYRLSPTARIDARRAGPLTVRTHGPIQPTEVIEEPGNLANIRPLVQLFTVSPQSLHYFLPSMIHDRLPQQGTLF
jgi:hypothetical protein